MIADARFSTTDAQRLIDQILAQLAMHSGRGPLTVAINGRTASGKSTLAERLVEDLRAELGSTAAVAYVKLDYYLPMGSDATQPGAEWQGYDWRPFMAMLDNAQLNIPQRVRERDWESGQYTGNFITIDKATQILVVDGVGILQDALMPLYGYTIWVECTAEESLQRGLARSAATPMPGGGTYAEAHADFWPKWVDKDNRYIAKYHPANKAQAIYITSQSPEDERVPVPV